MFTARRKASSGPWCRAQRTTVAVPALLVQATEPRVQFFQLLQCAQRLGHLAELALANRNQIENVPVLRDFPTQLVGCCQRLAIAILLGQRSNALDFELNRGWRCGSEIHTAKKSGHRCPLLILREWGT